MNRRVVVDQATAEAMEMAASLDELKRSGDLELVPALRAYSNTDRLLAISALRGELADNREWSSDPSVPAVVIGTVDMIGSRLLFRGYGDGRYFRPYHAGLLGVDALIANDEAHLTPAFARLLIAIRELSPASRLQHKPFHVLLVSATERGVGKKPFDFGMDADVRDSARFRAVYDAEKQLTLHEVPDNKAAQAKLLALALEEPRSRTVVFIERPEEAAKFAEKIESEAGADRVALLTGTMRGWERDRLATESEAFRRFQDARGGGDACWLVTTSAGEVGVNVSGDRLITMLAESDHLLQRLGRLNRFGDQEGEPHRVGQGHVVYFSPKKDAANEARVKTLEYLRSLPKVGSGYDVSCRCLHENPPGPETRSAEPKTARLEDWLIDLWSQTTAGNACAPAVEHWLHGAQEDEPPETAIAWRKEVELLADRRLESKDRDRALEAYRLLPHERLSEPSKRVQEKLREIAETKADTAALFISADGESSVHTVGELAADDFVLEHGTVLLPPGCGGMVRGMFRPEASEGAEYDVADLQAGTMRRRYTVELDGERWMWRAMGSGEAEEGPDPRDRRSVNAKAHRAGMAPAAVIAVSGVDADEDATRRYLVFFPGSAKAKAVWREVGLDEHCDAVRAAAADLAGRLLGEEFRDVYAAAGALHDQGKANEIWQRSMGGDLTRPLAKTSGGGSPSLLAGFRHELASLVAVPENADALTKYLVGCHHGWGRPYWEPKAFDRKQTRLSSAAAQEALRRFGQLQRRWGPWGLAYLDAVFKAADAIVSRAEGEATGE